MTDKDVDFEKRLLAAAVFELRVLLSSHIHALAVLDGQPIDVAQALDSVAKLESRLGSAYVQQFRRIVLNEI
jgi:hypothetical protein